MTTMNQINDKVSRDESDENQYDYHESNQRQNIKRSE